MEPEVSPEQGCDLAKFDLLSSHFHEHHLSSCLIPKSLTPVVSDRFTALSVNVLTNNEVFL